MRRDERSERRVIVVGGGASGVLAAINLSRSLGPDGEVVVIEPGRSPGLGLAYATRDPNHLLNVRVSNMSAFPNDPDHLFRWLQKNGPGEGVGCSTHFCFVPRRVYGSYLRSLFDDALMETVVHLQGTAVALQPRRDGVDVTLADGRRLAAAAVVLATGHDAKPRSRPGVVDAWDPQATADLHPDAEVAILGTGLTMADVVLTLRGNGHRGRIHALSRRGLVSTRHAVAPARPVSRADVPVGAPLSRILSWLRREVRRAEAQGIDWRSVVDALRPHTRALWQGMSTAERARFLRHARPWWDVHRHRMAPSVAEALENLRLDGRLQVTAAKLLDTREADGVELTIRRRGSTEAERLRVARLIDATGLPSDVRASGNPLVRDLFAKGLAGVDPLGLGLAVSDDYALIDAQGRASDRIFAVGPLCRAAFWEIIAIPDIRQQCGELADTIARDVVGRSLRTPRAGAA